MNVKLKMHMFAFAWIKQDIHKRLFCLSILCLQVLYNQFKYFFNLYFLLLACSQFVDELRLGALYTYWVPLVGSPS